MKRLLAVVLCVLTFTMIVPTEVFAATHNGFHAVSVGGETKKFNPYELNTFWFSAGDDVGQVYIEISIEHKLTIDSGYDFQFSLTKSTRYNEDTDKWYSFRVTSTSMEPVIIPLHRNSGYINLHPSADLVKYVHVTLRGTCADHVNATTTVIEEATCDKEGKEKIVCKDCGISETRTTEKLDHSFSKWQESTEATCLTVGEEIRICAGCGKKETREIDKLKHTYSKWEQVKKATCSEEGQEKRICSTCNTEETREIEKLSHKYGRWEETKAPTCSSEGEKKRVCSVCNNVEIQPVEPVAHKYSRWEETKEATCSEPGEEKRTCSVCNYVDERETDTKKHTYGAWTTTQKATCDSEGQRERVCKVCSHVEIDEIDKTRHDFGSWKVTKQATESSSGSRTRTCRECGYVEKDTIERLEHGDETYTKVIEEATCENEGKQEIYCEYCDKRIRTKTIDKKDHNVKTWMIVSEATPNSKGKREGRCTECREKIVESIEFERPGRNGFKTKRTYDHRFKDIKSTNWYYNYVTKAYEYELANGMSADTFSPDSSFTVGQTLTIASNIHSAYYGYKVEKQKQGEMWYMPYVNYCIEHNIITKNQFYDYDRNITRGEMAIVFASILPDEEYKQVRSGSPSDVKSNSACYDAVKKLYRSGIVSGDKETGNYRPNDEIKRSEACAIFTAIVIPNYRAK